MMDSRQIVVFIYATWLGDLKPAFDEEELFFEKGLARFERKYQYDRVHSHTSRDCF
jgi:hypothetical protein